MGLVEDFSWLSSNPLILLLVGSAITGILVPMLTKKWQDRKKKIEIKVQLVERMSKLMSELLAGAAFQVMRKKEKLSDEELNRELEAIRNNFSELNAISSNLKAFFPKTQLAESWKEYSITLASFANASSLYFRFRDSETNRKLLEFHLREVQKYLTQNIGSSKPLTTEYNSENWDWTAEELYAIGEKIIVMVIEAKIRAF